MNFDTYINQVPYPTRELKAVDYNVQVKWRNEQHRLHALFRKDLLEDLGITNHPKADKLFEMAWDNGHSEGLQAVYDWAVELSELLS